MPTQVIMPQLGESVVEGTVTRWLKQPGAAVQENEALLEINTDKVDAEIPSPAAGTLLQILVNEGVTVRAGTPLAWIGQPGEPVPGGALSRPQAAQAQPAADPAKSRMASFVSPVVARLSREKQVDLSLVQGSGEGGRVTKKDVLAYIEARDAVVPPAARMVSPWETPGDGDLFRPTELVFAGQPIPSVPPLDLSRANTLIAAGDELVPLTAMRRTIAEAMVLSKSNAPHVSTIMEADVSRVAAHREANKPIFARENVNLTFTAYFAMAAIRALKTFPMVNSSWSDAGIQVFHAIHLGIAVALGGEGLIVPVIRNADDLSLLGLARSLNDLAVRGRSRKLKPDEVKNGTFTLTNHGTGGSLFATPVINPPQCGILGVGAIQKRVIVVDDMIAIRPMVYLSFTFDHRILDGISADAFLGKVKAELENWN